MAVVLVVNPYVPSQIKQDKVMNMGVLTVASALASEFDVKIVDHYSNPLKQVKEWFDDDTKVVAFSCSGAESYYASLIEARKIKKEISGYCYTNGRTTYFRFISVEHSAN